MNAPRYGPGIEITAQSDARFAQILTPDAVAFAARLQRAFGARRTELLARRAARQARFDAGELPDFLPETRAIRDGDWTCAPVPADIAGSPRRDHRPRRPQDDHQRAQLAARTCSWRTSRMRTRRAGTTTSRASSTCATRSAARIDYVSPEGKAYRLNEQTATLFVRPRGWHLPEKHVLDRRRADLRRHLRLRAVLLPQREGAHRARQRAVLLPAEAREPSRGAAVERHLRHGAGRPRHPARHDQGDGADRDDPRGVRDGRDPLRAARPLGRAQLPAAGTTSSAASRSSAATATSASPTARWSR